MAYTREQLADAVQYWWWSRPGGISSKTHPELGEWRKKFKSWTEQLKKQYPEDFDVFHNEWNKYYKIRSKEIDKELEAKRQAHLTSSIITGGAFFAAGALAPSLFAGSAPAAAGTTAAGATAAGGISTGKALAYGALGLGAMSLLSGTTKPAPSYAPAPAAPAAPPAAVKESIHPAIVRETAMAKADVRRRPRGRASTMLAGMVYRPTLQNLYEPEKLKTFLGE